MSFKDNLNTGLNIQQSLKLANLEKIAKEQKQLEKEKLEEDRPPKSKQELFKELISEILWNPHYLVAFVQYLNLDIDQFASELHGLVQPKTLDEAKKLVNDIGSSSILEYKSEIQKCFADTGELLAAYTEHKKIVDEAMRKITIEEIFSNPFAFIVFLQYIKGKINDYVKFVSPNTFKSAEDMIIKNPTGAFKIAPMMQPDLISKMKSLFSSPEELQGALQTYCADKNEIKEE